jgi:class 3 adenylate cyclase
VVNLNERLDYFGSTVNLAARLPDFSSGGEIIFSEAIRHDTDVEDFLSQAIAPNALSPFQAQIRGLDEPMQLWKIKL